MPPPLSEACKDRIEVYIRLEYATTVIQDIEGVGDFVVKKIRRNLKEYGQHTAPRQQPGAPRLIDGFVAQGLHDYLVHRPWAYQDEMMLYLYDQWDIVCDQSTVSRALKHYGISRKRLQREALERSQICRDNYMLSLSEFTDDQLCFLDESACNEHTLHRKKGWAAYGITPRAIRPVKRSERWSLLPVYTKDGILTYHIHQGGYTQILFEWFLVNKVLPQCNAFPEPRSVLIMDNASIHHHRDVKALCAEAGVRVLYLPPYSPDYNPIEEFFSVLKAWLKRQYNDIPVSEDEFKGVLYEAVNACSSRKLARAHFRRAGIKIN